MSLSLLILDYSCSNRVAAVRAGAFQLAQDFFIFQSECHHAAPRFGSSPVKDPGGRTLHSDAL